MLKDQPDLRLLFLLLPFFLCQNKFLPVNSFPGIIAKLRLFFPAFQGLVPYNWREREKVKEPLASGIWGKVWLELPVDEKDSY